MKRLIFFAAMFIYVPTQAQQIRVEKIRGSRAVIQFSGDLIPGKTYSLVAPSKNAKGGKRNYSLAGSLSFSNSTFQSTLGGGSSPHKDFTIAVLFGWNFETYELGPILSYRNLDSDYSGAHYSMFSTGGFFDYNLSPNRPGVSHIFGATAEATMGSSNAANGNNSSSMDFFVGGFYKWFGLGESSALRGDLGYDYSKTSFSGGSATLQGFQLRGSIATYF